MKIGINSRNNEQRKQFKRYIIKIPEKSEKISHIENII